MQTNTYGGFELSGDRSLADSSYRRAYVLRGTAYHVAANPVVRQRLYDELRAAISNPSHLPSMAELERLSYLSAVVHEGLRLCEPVTHHILRQFPDKTLYCHGDVISACTIVGMTGYLIQQNENIFPAPHVFRPERWLTDFACLFAGSVLDVGR